MSKAMIGAIAALCTAGIVTCAQATPSLTRDVTRSLQRERFVRRQLPEAYTHQRFRRRVVLRGPYSSTSTLSFATPTRIMPSRSAAARERSKMRPRGP